MKWISEVSIILRIWTWKTCVTNYKDSFEAMYHKRTLLPKYLSAEWRIYSQSQDLFRKCFCPGTWLFLQDNSYVTELGIRTQMTTNFGSKSARMWLIWQAFLTYGLTVTFYVESATKVEPIVLNLSEKTTVDQSTCCFINYI